MFPASSHVLSKRAKAISTPAFVAIIVSAVLTFNIVIFIAWVVMRQKRKRQPSEHRNISQAVQRPRASRTQAPSETSPMEQIRSSEPSCPELVYSLLTESANTQSTGPHLCTMTDSGLLGDPTKPAVVVLADANGVSSCGDARSPHPERIVDEEAASMYSSASAPLEYHELLLQPQILNLTRLLPPIPPTVVSPASLLTVPPAGVPHASVAPTVGTNVYIVPSTAVESRRTSVVGVYRPANCDYLPADAREIGGVDPYNPASAAPRPIPRIRTLSPAHVRRRSTPVRSGDGAKGMGRAPVSSNNPSSALTHTSASPPIRQKPRNTLIKSKGSTTASHISVRRVQARRIPKMIWKEDGIEP